MSRTLRQPRREPAERPFPYIPRAVPVTAGLATLDKSADRMIASVARAQGITWPDDDDDD